jgi:DNA-binding MarR family transcriptional regulator
VVLLVSKTNGGFLIGKIKQIQGRVFEKLLTSHGIDQFNGAQGRILFVLWDHDSIPISELSNRTGLAKTTLTSMLDRLEASGHVRRVFDPEDRRKVNIRLTDEARGLKDRYGAVSREMSEIFYEGFTDGEIAAFEISLERVLRNLTRREASK